MKTLLIALILMMAMAVAPAAEPPDYINYQGVLRDASYDPLDGSHDMVFRFYDADILGDLLLTDTHTAVTVSGGLFNLHLGGGVLTPGIYDTLADVFANESEVWLEIDVGVETLSPRVRVIAAAYALNADHLDGRDSGEFLDTSSAAQMKSGPLTLETTELVTPALSASGRFAGGRFEDTDESGLAYAAQGNVGIAAYGSAFAGYFLNPYWSSAGFIGTDAYGIEAQGPVAGGYFTNTSRASEVYLGTGTAGIEASGSEYGGYFHGTVWGETIKPGPGGIVFMDGSTARAVPLTNYTSRLDSEGDVGRYTSIAIGTDNLPVISYFDSSSQLLKVAHCDNSVCLSRTVEYVTSGGRHTSIAIYPNGLPVISHTHEGMPGDASLKLALCHDEYCNGATNRTITPGVSAYTSIAIGADGFPIISYYQDASGDLRVAHCEDASCENWDLTTLDSGGDVGLYTSIAIGTDGLPVISYHDATNRELKAVHCLDVECSTFETPTTLIDQGYVGFHTSIAIGTDGRPVISYLDRSDDIYDWVVMARCVDLACSSATKEGVDLILTSAESDTSTSIAIGTDGLPVIAYTAAGDLKVAQCEDANCSSATIKTAYSTGDVGLYSSIALGTDGLPTISHYDKTNGDLMLTVKITFPENGNGESTGAMAEQGGDRVRSTGTEQTVTGVAARRAASPSTGAAGSGLPGIRTDDEGNVYARSFRPSASDLASTAQIAERVGPGDVVVIDSQRPGLLALSRQAADTAVFGIVAGEPGVVLGAEPPPEKVLAEEPGDEAASAESMSSEDFEELATASRAPIAVSGVAMCKVDAGFGSIRPGDLLTTSPTPGHAMLAFEPMPGTILGKALEPFDTGTGLIKVLVMLR